MIGNIGNEYWVKYLGRRYFGLCDARSCVLGEVLGLCTARRRAFVIRHMHFFFFFASYLVQAYVVYKYKKIVFCL